jgi:hypothetical protein
MSLLTGLVRFAVVVAINLGLLYLVVLVAKIAWQ